MEMGTVVVTVFGAEARRGRSARTELILRVGLLAGRYLHEYDLAEAVADDAFAGWLMLDTKGPDLSVEQWWDEYVNRVESQVGGYDSATTEQLEHAWLTHARSLRAPAGVGNRGRSASSLDCQAPPVGSLREHARGQQRPVDPGLGGLAAR
jgi:hypothetical protein